MGKPYRRLKYDPPENYGHDDMIEHGKAVSMITDLLAQDVSAGIGGGRWTIMFGTPSNEDSLRLLPRDILNFVR